MKTYRYGVKENAVGNTWCSIEKKGFLGFWFEVFEFQSMDEMMRVVSQLRDNGHIVFQA